MYALMCAGAMLVTGFSCKNVNNGGTECTAPANGIMELVAPAGGGSYSVGDTVTIEFKFDKLKVASVEIQVYDIGVMDWVNIVETSIPGEGADNNQCKTFVWIIGSGTDRIDYSRGGFGYKVRIAEYGNNSGNNDESAAFTINPRE